MEVKFNRCPLHNCFFPKLIIGNQGDAIESVIALQSRRRGFDSRREQFFPVFFLFPHVRISNHWPKRGNFVSVFCPDPRMKVGKVHMTAIVISFNAKMS